MRGTPSKPHQCTNQIPENCLQYIIIRISRIIITNPFI
jgi:hypothetical protein